MREELRARLRKYNTWHRPFDDVQPFSREEAVQAELSGEPWPLNYKGVLYTPEELMQAIESGKFGLVDFDTLPKKFAELLIRVRNGECRF